jgi:hypothetical protein
VNTNQNEITRTGHGSTVTPGNRAARAVRVSTARYVYSHGRAPRGEGYWIFEGQSSPHGAAGYVVWEQNGLYSVARRAAEAEARARGVRYLWVAP